MAMRRIEFNFEPADFAAAGLLMRRWLAEGWNAAGSWLRQALDEHPGGIVVDDDPMLPPRTPGMPRFNATAWLYADPLRLRLEMGAEAGFLSSGAVDIFLDTFAREGRLTSMADSVTEW